MRIEIVMSVGIAFCFISFVYWKLYYSRLTRALNNKSKKGFSIVPASMTMLLALGSLTIISVNSIIYANSLENEILLIESQYDDIEFHNDFIEEVYTKYNIYFAGYYNEEDTLIVCLTHNTPEEIIMKADNLNQQIKCVKNNYNELLSIYNLVVNDRANLGTGESMSVYIDIRENIVVISTPSKTNFEEAYSIYIEEGLLKVLESGNVSYL